MRSAPGPAADRSVPGRTIRRPGVVCKVGGALLDGGMAGAPMAALRRVAPAVGVLIVPGGGRTADRVRARHEAGELSAREAHWAAIDALDVNALRLARGCGAELPLVTGPELGDTASGPAVLAPSPILRSEDPLPHSWDVTTDSIAAWITGRVEASRLVLLKAREAIAPPEAGPRPRSLSGARAAADGLVDRHLPALLPDAPYETWAVDGRRPARLLAFLTGDRRAGTRLLP